MMNKQEDRSSLYRIVLNGTRNLYYALYIYKIYIMEP